MKFNGRLVIPLLTSTFIASNALAEGNDTYNFYFQKAPGPTTVIQGAGASPDSNSIANSTAVTGAVKTDVVASTSQGGSAPIQEKSVPVMTTRSEVDRPQSPRRWSIFVGWAADLDQTSTNKGFAGDSIEKNYGSSSAYNSDGVGVAIGAAFAVTETLSTDLYVQSVRVNRMQCHIGDICANTESQSTNLAFGLSLMPIEISLFGANFTRVGVSAGAMTKTIYSEFAYSEEKETKVVGYVGPTLDLKLGDRSSIFGTYRYGQNGYGNQADAGLKVRF